MVAGHHRPAPVGDHGAQPGRIDRFADQPLDQHRRKRQQQRIGHLPLPHHRNRQRQRGPLDEQAVVEVAVDHLVFIEHRARQALRAQGQLVAFPDRLLMLPARGPEVGQRLALGNGRVDQLFAARADQRDQAAGPVPGDLAAVGVERAPVALVDDAGGGQHLQLRLAVVQFAVHRLYQRLGQRAQLVLGQLPLMPRLRHQQCQRAQQQRHGHEKQQQAEGLVQISGFHHGRWAQAAMKILAVRTSPAS
ncbi:MAG: hypothetical protein JWP79_864 [Polaromonas sp.]|nr:hypothetical protein [Polaromonas sp.]